MKKRVLVVLLIMLCCFSCISVVSCVDSDLVGTYRSIDSSSNIKYYIELYSSGKCKVYRLGEGEIKDTLIDGATLFNGKFDYKYDKKSDDDKSGTITITVTYEAANGKETESFEGKILESGKISLYIWGSNRTFKKIYD